MAATIEEVDPVTAPDAVLLAVHEVELACADDVAPGEPWRTADEALAYFRHPPAVERRRRWLARVEDIVVGTAGLFVHSRQSAYAQVRVAPEHRCAGIGSGLLEPVVAGAQAVGSRALVVHHACAAGAAFAARVGAVDDRRDVRSVLRLEAADLAVSAPPPGYRLRTWLGAAPDELVGSYAAARNAIADAPDIAGYEEPPWTVDRVRDLEDSVARRACETRVTVALTGDDTVAAFTELRVSAAPTATASTEDTATLVAHRRRGLATAVKAESLLRLRGDRPDVGLVTTSNAEENTAMRAVNERVGFRPVAVWTTTVLAL
jgi:GNAT superfamily N-acetyltransferase